MVSRWRRTIAVLLVVLALGLTSCGGDRNTPAILLEDENTSTTNPLIGSLAEVSPPERIQQLKPYLDVYEPQVRIISPRDSALLKDTTVAVELQVRDFPIYKDVDLDFGPHLHLFLDDQPHQAIYDIEEPIVFTDLAPGTHTLRVVAARPWDESFKSDGAYDQVTFSVFTASPQNDPDESQPLLTYGQPQGSYGAEPIMLDFYLKNAPLHLVAESDEAIADWRIRCTVNGESFLFDRWQPIYLKGFQPGKNWLKLEIVDENGDLINNAFNTGVRVIEYTPGGKDGLSQLVRGEVPLSRAMGLVDPNYMPPTPVTEEEPIEPESETPVLEPALTEEVTPEEETAPAIVPSIDKSEASPEVTETIPASEPLELETGRATELPEAEELTPEPSLDVPATSESPQNAESNLSEEDISEEDIEAIEAVEDPRDDVENSASITDLESESSVTEVLPETTASEAGIDTQSEAVEDTSLNTSLEVESSATEALQETPASEEDAIAPAEPEENPSAIPEGQAPTAASDNPEDISELPEITESEENKDELEFNELEFDELEFDDAASPTSTEFDKSELEADVAPPPNTAAPPKNSAEFDFI